MYNIYIKHVTCYITYSIYILYVKYNNVYMKNGT